MTAAKPMTKAKIMDLLSNSSKAAFKPFKEVAFDRAMLARDGCAFCLMCVCVRQGYRASMPQTVC